MRWNSGGTTARRDTYKLFANSLCKSSKAHWSAGSFLLSVENVLCQLCNTLCIGITFKDEAKLFQDLPQLFVVCNDSVVDHSEFISRVRAMRMRVSLGRSTVSSPSSVGHSSRSHKDLFHVNILQVSNLHTQGIDLADLFKDKSLGGLGYEERLERALCLLAE